MSSATPAASKRAKTPSTAQPSSIRTRSMSSTKLAINTTARRGSLPAAVKGRRALDLKTINRRYDEDDQLASAAAGPSKLADCSGQDGAERPAKLARKGRSPVKGGKAKAKERIREIAGEDAEMGAASEDELADEHKPARFLPIPPRSPISGHHPSTSHATNPFHVRLNPTTATALQPSPRKHDDTEMARSDDSSESDDSLLLMPSPRKVSPQKPSALSNLSFVPASGMKRSRSDAFVSSPAGHTSPPKFVMPKTPTVDVANPFYVSPAPKPQPPPAASFSSSNVATASIAPTIAESSSFTSGISTTIDSLNLRTPQSQRKRAREVFSGSHATSPPETGTGIAPAAPTPMKSCFSSSSSGSGSSPASRSSSDGDGASPRKRVHFSSPPPAPAPDEDATMDSPSSAKGVVDPLSSPPSAAASSLPPMIDIVALSKRKLKSPRKRVMPKPLDGSMLSGVRDGARAVKKLEGLTVPKAFAFGSMRGSASVSTGLASLVANGKVKETEKAVKQGGDASMGPPALPRAFGAYASTSTSLVPTAGKRTGLPSSGGGMSTSSSRTNLSSLGQSTSRIPLASGSLSASVSSTATITSSRPTTSTMKTSLPSSRSISSLSSLSNPKRAAVPSSSAAPTVPSLSASTSSSASARPSRYPSSLGSRPPPSSNRPPPSTARKTSVPVPASAMNLPKPPPRAVSDPVASAGPVAPPRVVRPLPASGPERKGLSSESRSAMAGLAESLAKMQVRKAAAAAAAGGGGAAGQGSKRMSSSSTMPNIAEAAHSRIRPTGSARPGMPSSSSSRVLHPPPDPPSSSGIPTSTSSRRLSTAPANRRESSSSSEGDSSFTSNGGGVSLTSSRSTQSLATLAADVDTASRALAGVVAFVDVRTAEGDEAGGMFVEILKGLGAKVLARPSDSVTHIIFKAGKTSTLAHYRKFAPAPAPVSAPTPDGMMALEDLVHVEELEQTTPAGKTIHLVGIGWVIRCKEEKSRVREYEYRVDPGEQSSFQKRRKSMEPKQMRLALEQPSGNPMAASVEKARRRSLLFAPRISSPLKRASFIAVPVEDDEDGPGDESNMLA